MGLHKLREPSVSSHRTAPDETKRETTLNRQQGPRIRTVFDGQSNRHLPEHVLHIDEELPSDLRQGLARAVFLIQQVSCDAPGSGCITEFSGPFSERPCTSAA
jgi:hypothetical protein